MFRHYYDWNKQKRPSQRRHLSLNAVFYDVSHQDLLSDKSAGSTNFGNCNDELANLLTWSSQYN